MAKALYTGVGDKAKKVKAIYVGVDGKARKVAKYAKLSYETLHSLADGTTLVRVRLYTGRTHQIRVQFASRGLPLLGDGKYGRERFNKDYDEKGQALYSYKLRFEFPTDAGILNYLRGREFTVDKVDFVEEYFPGTKI